MSGKDPAAASRAVQSLFGSGRLGALSDGQLLERFVARDDPAAAEAFALLVERHGPMVWGVCRRALPDRDAAADAFQATFLVLLRRAAAVRVADSLGPWLYGVGRRVAARARATSLRRRGREAGAVEALAGPAPDPDRAERLAILDEEIGRLPEHQRAAVVLCDLQGLPHEEAARRLGCPVGTVESRLHRGRRRLRDRLIRRGLAPAAAATWAESARAASAALPTALVRQTARCAPSSPAAGGVPAAVTALVEGVLPMMSLARWKAPAALAATLALATAGVAVQGRQNPAPVAAPPPAQGAPRPAAGAAPDVAANRALARQQLALIDQIWTVQYNLARASRFDINDASFTLWGRRRLDLLHKAGAGKAEIVAALEKYFNNLKDYEALAKDLQERARSSTLGVLHAEYLIREAEMWLNEEKAR